MERAIFQPIQIRGMTIRNRIGMAPFLNNPVGEDGGVGDLTVRWFEARAKGGTGLIMTGAIRPSKFGQDIPTTPEQDIPVARSGLALNDDKYIPGFARLARAIHAHGSVIGVQIAVIGPMGGLGMSPAPYSDERHARDTTGDIFMGGFVPVRELTVDELHLLQDDIARAAARAKEAGIDCVELHCAHGGATLHCSSISPYYNRRTDDYGGNWEKRLRFATETIQKMRAAVGEDYPILARISADELLGERGIQLEDTTQIIVLALEEAGVDCFDVSQGSIIHTPEGITIPMYYPRGCYIHNAAAVKKVANRPVIGVGRIVEVDMAERFLQEGKADIIYFGRLTTADPEGPNKYAEGRTADIRPCVGCLEGCGRPCPVNYEIQDSPVPFAVADRSRSVLVIGGGVGGMEAARVAALRGHRVTIIEKDSRLGGMVAALGQNPLTAEFGAFVDYLARQMRELGVEVRLCEEATLGKVQELSPDVIILAAGSSLVVPEEARGKPGVMTHIEALRHQQGIGQRVVIWGLVAGELAVSLAQQGKDVVMIGRGGEETLARDQRGSRRLYLFRRLTDVNAARGTPEAQRLDNVEVLYHVDVEDVTPEGMHIVFKGGRRRVLPYDTLIISRERTSNDGLFEQLQGTAPEVYKIGDCADVGDIKAAVWSANEVARRI